MDENDLSPAELAALADREHDWDATGDATVLWPALNVSALQPAADDIGRAVSDVLQGRRASLASADGGDSYAIGIAALLTGVGPLLGSWVESGQLDVSEPVARVLARHLTQSRRRMERIHAGLRPALVSLREHGVVPAVIKGMHTAHVYFDEPGVRPLADVDVVITPDELPRAEMALRAVGFTPCGAESPEKKRVWRPPCDDGLTRSFELWHARSTWKLEVHAGIVFDHLTEYGVQLERHAMFDVRFDQLGVPVQVARQPLLLALLATHASGELTFARLLRLVEITLVIRRDRAAGLLDWSALETLLESAGALRFAHPAFALVEQLAPGTVDARLLASTRRASTRRTLAVVREFTPTFPVLQGKTSLAQRVMWTATTWQLAGRLLRMLLPPRRASLSYVWTAYHARLSRLLSGAVTWRATSEAPPPIDRGS
jgi:hypothetical protein